MRYLRTGAVSDFSFPDLADTWLIVIIYKYVSNEQTACVEVRETYLETQFLFLYPLNPTYVLPFTCIRLVPDLP